MSVFNFIENMEDVFLSYLDRNGINPYVTGDPDKREEEMVAIRVDVGPSTGVLEKPAVTKTGVSEYSQYTATLTIEVYTPRENNTHPERVSTVRRLFLRGSIMGNNVNIDPIQCELYYYDEFRPTGEARSVTELDQDVSVLTYDYIFQIQPDAWEK